MPMRSRTRRSKPWYSRRPHSFHEAQIEAAVAAGKHVFCEKPLALTKSGAEKAVAPVPRRGIGARHGARAALGAAGRRHVGARRIPGELGRIHQIEANFSHDKFLALDRDNWRLKADQAPAGGMTATGIHLLDSVGAACSALRPAYCACLRTAFLRSAAGRHRRGLCDQVPGRRHVLCLGFAGQSVHFALSRCLARRVGSTSATRRMSRRPTVGSSPRRWRADASRPKEVPPAEPVKDNLVAFARAVSAAAQPIPITAAHLVDNIALLEAVFASALSGKIEAVA